MVRAKLAPRRCTQGSPNQSEPPSCRDIGAVVSTATERVTALEPSQKSAEFTGGGHAVKGRLACSWKLQSERDQSRFVSRSQAAGWANPSYLCHGQQAGDRAASQAVAESLACSSGCVTSFNITGFPLCGECLQLTHWVILNLLPTVKVAPLVYFGRPGCQPASARSVLVQGV